MIGADEFPYTGPYSVDGNGLHKGPTALALKRAMSRMGQLPWEPAVWDQHFNRKLEDALDGWDPGKNGYAEGRWERIRKAKVPPGRTHSGEYALDSVCLDLVHDEWLARAPWATIGPVFNGGASVLQHDCTHATSNLPLYPAFDDAFKQGVHVIAPEQLVVTDTGTSNPGRSFYADGVSGLRWWFGHLAASPPIGKTFTRGQTVGQVAANSVGGGPHVHVGVNVERLWGNGTQLIHRTNYTHGAPLIGDQLAMWGT